MASRLERLQDCVLKENDRFRCRDNHINDLLASGDDAEKLRIIREEYARAIEIDENSLLAGQYPSVPFFERKQTAISPEDWHALTRKYRDLNENVYIIGGNHFSADFENVITRGIAELLRQAEEKRSAVTEEDQREFLDDLCFAAGAIIAWAQAHADALRVAAAKETAEERRAELAQMADICSRVPRLPATNFREAIQSYYFAFILFPDGLGRLDQYLYPYYATDIQKGTLTEQQALELIEELFLKIFAFLGVDEARSGNNHCVIGGYTTDGVCGHNECTSLILEAIAALPIWRPQVSYRVTAKTTEAQLRQAVEAHYKRPDLIMFLNDDAIVDGLISVGADHADAINYSSSGCNETMLTGCSQMGALEGHINIMHSLERMMKDIDELPPFENFDAFYAAFEEYLREDLALTFRYCVDLDAVMASRREIVSSLLTEGCIDSATPLTSGGAKYNFCTWCLTGLVNLVDSLSVIRQMVFDEKRFSLPQLGQFLRSNWDGYEGQRAYIRNNGRYFGNDDDYVDRLINKVAASVNNFAKKHTPYRGGRYLFGTLTGYELSHVCFGKASGASPDGRYAGDPFAASIAPSAGADKSSMTAYLKSAAKIDGRQIQSSVVVNLKIDRSLADSEEKRVRLTAVLRTYFALGGIQLQINYLSADELRRAQKDPTHYQNLRVRVTGFSGFFTSFDKDLQDEIIERYTYTV